MDQRTSVAKALRGQSVAFKKPDEWFSEWPRLVNARLEDLRKHVEDTTQQTYRNHPKLKALKRSDFGLFGATWWPNAPYERLQIVTELTIWLFIWDDEIDSAAGTFGMSSEKAQAFREDTIRFVSYSLGIETADTVPNVTNPIIQAFESFGARLRVQAEYDLRVRLFREIVYFMSKSEKEQQHALSGRIITLDEYWNFRMGTSAVTVVLVLNEFAGALSLPAEILDQPDMQLAWDACNGIISIVNDIFSLKKELAEDAVDNVIPIRYAVTGDAQEAADLAFEMVDQCVKNLELAGERLTAVVEGNERLTKDVEKVIWGCKCFCTGNLVWSLSTDRYRAKVQITEEAMYVTL